MQEVISWETYLPQLIWRGGNILSQVHFQRHIHKCHCHRLIRRLCAMSLCNKTTLLCRYLPQTSISPVSFLACLSHIGMAAPFGRDHCSGIRKVSKGSDGMLGVLSIHWLISFLNYDADSCCWQASFNYLYFMHYFSCCWFCKLCL